MTTGAGALEGCLNVKYEREGGRKRERKEGSMGRKTQKPCRKRFSPRVPYLAFVSPYTCLSLQAGFILMFDSIRNSVLQQFFSCLEKKKSYLGLLAGYFLW